MNGGSRIVLGKGNSANTAGGTGTGYYNISGGVLNTTSLRVGGWGSGTVYEGASTGVFTQTGGTVGGSTRPDVFLLELELGGTGSVTDLAHWMTEAGLNATADSVANTVTLADLPVPSGGPSYFFWDLRDYNAVYGTTFVVSSITAIPEPSAPMLALLGLAGLALRHGAKRRCTAARRRRRGCAGETG